MFFINNEAWDIQLVPSGSDSLNRSDGSSALAVCDNNSKTIFIDEGVNEDKLLKILCHEITHACMFSNNIYIPIEEEEFIADLIATYGTEIVYLSKKLYRQIKYNRIKRLR